ncbi:MAG: 2-hydroxyacid dehydrogenase [Pyrinomonadaceae bacterium]
MKRILMTGEGYTEEQVRRIRALGFDITHEIEISPDRFHSLLPSIDAHILGGSELLDAKAITRADRLRVVSFVGTGYGTFVDVEAARKRNILIVNTPEVMAQAVAEHTIGFLIGLVRGLFEQNEAVKRLEFSRRTPTVELAGMTVGLLGMGAIGTRIARILTTVFGCTVLYNSRTRKTALEGELGIDFVDVEKLFAASQAIVVAIPLTHETTNIIDASLLNKARPGLMLVNTASAKLVSPEALKQALESGHVAAAAFDGYWIEPLPEPGADPFGLLSFPDSQFVVTPHSASKTTTVWSRMIAMAVDNVIKAFTESGEKI